MNIDVFYEKKEYIRFCYTGTYVVVINGMSHDFSSFVDAKDLIDSVHFEQSSLSKPPLYTGNTLQLYSFPLPGEAKSRL